MKKPIIVLLLFYSISMLVESCCSGESSYCASIRTTFLEVYDNSGAEPAAVGNSVKATDMMIRLNIDFLKNSCKAKPSFSLINTAYATSCHINDIYFINDTVRNIVVTADKPYSELHPVGAGLGEFFDIPKRTDHDRREHPTDVYDIRALEPPAQAGIYTYKVVLIMKSGKRYEATSEPINVTL